MQARKSNWSIWLWAILPRDHTFNKVRTTKTWRMNHQRSKGTKHSPLHVKSGVCVLRSQKRTVVSPEPLARNFPSGLKETASTASVWPECKGEDCLNKESGVSLLGTVNRRQLPAIVAEHRLIGLIRKRACGWYTMRRVTSTLAWSIKNRRGGNRN